MELRLSLTFVLLCHLLPCVLSDQWTHHTVLDGDGKYHLYWKPPEDKESDSEITFKVEVETNGYVGFGLSLKGGMDGSDIITAWITDGQVFFQDMYVVKYNLFKDAKQDWKLISGYENETFTVFTFSRKLDTKDEHDMVIDDSTMRVIYAYHSMNPGYENPVYHSRNRGSKSLMLLQDKVKNLDLDLSSLLQWNIESPEIDISSNRSLYWCKIFRTPLVSKKHHIVYVKPQIQTGHEQFVHHMLLYECVGGKPEEYEEHLTNRGHRCHHPNMPDAMKKCEGVSITWGVGGEDVVFPDHVGLPLDPEPGTYFMLEIHYDNPHLESDIIDHSGLTIYYTPNLRKYDAGSLMIGSTISPRVFIPPGQKNYVVVGHSNPDCLASEFGKSGVKALGVLLHSHLLGRQIKARHFRGSMELTPLADDKNYDFNYQEYRYFKKEVDILENDQITVECTYDSSERSNVTFGGESTRDEMCLAFVLYYPRVKRYASVSVPTYDNINKVLKTNYTDLHSLYFGLSAYNWSSADIREVEDVMKNSAHVTHCYLGDGQKDSVSSLVSYPADTMLVEYDLSSSQDSSYSGSEILRHERSSFLVICVFILILSL